MTSFKMMLLTAAVLAVPSTANAALVGNLGGGTGPFRTLTSAGLDGGAVATLSGGTVYTMDQPAADIPGVNQVDRSFLAAGPTSGATATLNFTAPVAYTSFLWGSPDAYNVLSVVTNVTSYSFTADSLNFARTDGNQSFAQYVQFTATAGETISSLSFTNVPSIDAFEVANFTVTAVPEPATWGMMLLGFGMVAGAARYRRRGTKVAFS
jgi:hypothetical protein